MGVVEIVGDDEGVRLGEFDILEVEVADADADEEDVETREETGENEVTEVTVAGRESSALPLETALLLSVTLSAWRGVPRAVPSIDNVAGKDFEATAGIVAPEEVLDV